MADLYQRHARQTLASIRPRVDTQEDAEDLLIEVFLAIMQNKMSLLSSNLFTLYKLTGLSTRSARQLRTRLVRPKKDTMPICVQLNWQLQIFK